MNTSTGNDRASHRTFYESGPYAQYLVQARSVGSAPIDMFEANQPAGHFPDPAFPNLLFYVAIRGCREARFDWGAGAWRGPWHADDLTLVPPDAASDVEMSERHRFLAFCFPAATVRLVHGDDRTAFLAGLERLFEQPFRDPLSHQLALELWRIGRAGDDDAAWYADHLATSLLGRLDRLNRPSTPADPGAARFAQLVDYIDAHLATKLSLRRMAGDWNLSARQLQAIARANAGLSLYQLILERRLLAAQAMLKRPNSDLAEVALACGFSSQAHLTSLFARRFGITPARARRVPIVKSWP
jgi:AraC family transcriptional regulator